MRWRWTMAAARWKRILGFEALNAEGLPFFTLHPSWYETSYVSRGAGVWEAQYQLTDNIPWYAVKKARRSLELWNKSSASADKDGEDGVSLR